MDDAAGDAACGVRTHNEIDAADFRSFAGMEPSLMRFDSIGINVLGVVLRARRCIYPRSPGNCADKVIARRKPIEPVVAAVVGLSRIDLLNHLSPILIVDLERDDLAVCNA